jgi:putative ABC transport system permease protein
VTWPDIRFPAMLVREAWYAAVQRPARLVLTALGVAAGVASLVATIGLSSTASAQISGEFNALLATEVGMGGSSGPAAFPPGAATRVDALPGVVAAGVWCTVDNNANVALSREALGTSAVQLRLVAADAGFARADNLSVSGVALGPQFSTIMAGDLGIGAARALGLSSQDLPVTLFADGRVVTVVGLITAAPVDPTLLASLVVPLPAAQQAWRTSTMPDQTMVILTRPGAAQVVASQAAIAADPVYPSSFTAQAPPEPAMLRNEVQGSVQDLFLSLAAVALIVSAFGIANTTLVSVVERRGEIGLRRAVGAHRRHIAVQFMFESGLTGLAGGVAGTCLGIAVVFAVSAAKTWTITMPGGLVLAAPGIGCLVGVVAGVYPALRAASIQPLAALRGQ